MRIVRRMIAWIAGFLGLLLMIGALAFEGGAIPFVMGLFMFVGGIIVDLMLTNKKI